VRTTTQKTAREGKESKGKYKEQKTLLSSFAFFASPNIRSVETAVVSYRSVERRPTKQETGFCSSFLFRTGAGGPLAREPSCLWRRALHFCWFAACLPPYLRESQNKKMKPLPRFDLVASSLVLVAAEKIQYGSRPSSLSRSLSVRSGQQSGLDLTRD